MRLGRAGVNGGRTARRHASQMTVATKGATSLPAAEIVRLG